MTMMYFEGHEFKGQGRR